MPAAGMGCGTGKRRKLPRSTTHPPSKKYLLQRISQTRIKGSESKFERSTTTMATAVSAPGTVSTWKIDPAHSAAEFKVKHMMISNVKGKFSGLSGALKLDETNYAHSTVDASIPVSTINTGEDQRDGHLKSAEFFDADKFPAMTFKSTNIDSTGGGSYEVTGDLTIRGVTKPVVLKVEDVSEPSKDPWGNHRIGLTGTTKINRKDFGVSYNSALETGGVLVGEEVAITLDLQFIKQ
jgi:polyisoprenoid-binding protein YceI